MSPKMLACTQRAPNFVAALTPSHFAAGCGAFQRLAPTGGAAYGMPRYCRTPVTPESAPLSRPASVVIGDWADAKGGSVSATSAAAVAATRARRASVQTMRDLLTSKRLRPKYGPTTRAEMKPADEIRACIDAAAGAHSNCPFGTCVPAPRRKGLSPAQARPFRAPASISSVAFQPCTSCGDAER